MLQTHLNKLNFNDSTDFIKMHDDDQDYWTQRMDHLKNEHQVINNIIENEYKVSIEKTDKLFEKQEIAHERIQKLKPCLDWRSKVVLKLHFKTVFVCIYLHLEIL